MNNLGELVEKLCIANIKLYNICEKKTQAAENPAGFSKDELIEIMRQDISLCRDRAALKNAINKTAGMNVAEEIKRYGNDS